MMRNTIVDMVFANAQKQGQQTAMTFAHGERWHSLTWHDYAESAKAFGAALLTLNYEPGWGVGILGNNRPEWLMTHIGSMSVRALPTGIYQTSTPSQIAYILNHSEARVVVIDTLEQWTKISSCLDELPLLKKVVVMEPIESAPDPMVITWAEFLTLGATHSDAFTERFESLQSDDLATLIYTSGTTGPPKGVMLSHHNLSWTARQTRRAIGGEVSSEDGVVSYLPLSHIAEQMFSIYLAAAYGYPICFAPSMEQLKETLLEARPTLFLAVPRVWEKFKAALELQLDGLTGFKKSLVAWARAVGARTGNDIINHGRPRGLDRLQFALADRLFYRPLRAKLGLDELKVAVTGAAPIGKEVLDFFVSCGIIIHEVYGQSEDTGPTSFNQPFAGERRLGTVGRPFPGVDVRLADDGEILVRGPNVFQGYYKDEAATQATLVDGWLHSGDIGTFDQDGFLRITDRKKDLIITAGGKNVAPQNLEKRLRAIDGIAQAVVIGDRRKYLTALLTVCPERGPRLAEENSWPVNPQDMVQDQRFEAYVQDAIEQTVNEDLARYEQIKKFTLLPEDFSQEAGELTPTQKLKRNVIIPKHESIIDAMYPPN
ncbi:MAG: AMP-dependent synthetase/ligase [Bradymonadia bacterium]